MGDTAKYHCGACSVRSRANLTLFDGKWWRPECLWTLTEMTPKTVTRMVEPETLVSSRAAEHGLVVVEGGKKRRRHAPSSVGHDPADGRGA